MKLIQAVWNGSEGLLEAVLQDDKGRNRRVLLRHHQKAGLLKTLPEGWMQMLEAEIAFQDGETADKEKGRQLP